MERRCPNCGTTLPAGVPAWVREKKVGDVMTRDPVTLGPEDRLMRALEVMRAHKVRRLPIVVADTLVGLLAEGDLKRAQPSILTDSQEEFESVMEATEIARIMIAKPVTIDEEAPLLDAVELLADTKYGALPVLREGRLVGIVTDADMLKSLAELLRHGG